MADGSTAVILSGLTLVFIPSLGWWLTRLIKAKDELTAKNLELWQVGAKERHQGLVDQITDLDECLSSVKVTLRTKVDITDCLRLSNDKWDRINRHSHNSEGNVVIPR